MMKLSKLETLHCGDSTSFHETQRSTLNENSLWHPIVYVIVLTICIIFPSSTQARFNNYQDSLINVDEVTVADTISLDQLGIKATAYKLHKNDLESQQIVEDLDTIQIPIGYGPAKAVLGGEKTFDLSYLALAILVLSFLFIFVYMDKFGSVMYPDELRASYIVVHTMTLVLSILCFLYLYYSSDLTHWTNDPEDIGWFWTIVNFILFTLTASFVIFNLIQHYFIVIVNNSLCKKLGKLNNLVSYYRAIAMIILETLAFIFVVLIAKNSAYVGIIWWSAACTMVLAEIICGLLRYLNSKKDHSLFEVTLGIITGSIYPWAFLMIVLYWASLVGTVCRHIFIS